MKKGLSILIVIVLVVGAVFKLYYNKQKNQREVAVVAQKNAQVAVRVAPVEYASSQNVFRLNGVFQAKYDLNVATEIPGQVVDIYVKEGQHIRAGEVLAKIKSDKIKVSLEQAESNLNQAKTEVKRFESAYKTGGVTLQQLEQMRLQLKNAQANYNSVKLTSSDAMVKSKISGIVNAKRVELGTFVAAGTPLFNVVDIDELKLKVFVDETQVSLLQKGQIVRLKPTVLPDFIEGKITFIASKSDGTLKFPVEIEVDNKNQKLKAGMYASVVFDGQTDKKILMVDRQAFVGSVSQNKIFRVKDGKAELVIVNSGRNFGDKVEIISGLSADDKIIISGQINLENGTPIKVME